MARKGSGERNQPNVEKMPLLLATVYEAARVMPAGPLLQRCSLKHGEPLLFLKVKIGNHLSLDIPFLIFLDQYMIITLEMDINLQQVLSVPN